MQHHVISQLTATSHIKKRIHLIIHVFQLTSLKRANGLKCSLFISLLDLLKRDLQGKRRRKENMDNRNRIRLTTSVHYFSHASHKLLMTWDSCRTRTVRRVDPYPPVSINLRSV